MTRHDSSSGSSSGHDAQPAPASGMHSGRTAPAAPSPVHGGMIVREASPLNLEMPFGELDEFITRTEHFFVRCHFPLPEIDPAHWRLRVTGEVRQPLELEWNELGAMPAVTRMSTMECAGNGRVFLSPQVDGAQWERGAVGNAEWTGVLLRDVLERARPTTSALEVVCIGADRGKIAEAPRPGGEIHYARSVPIAKAIDDVLLAWAMNGETLTPTHGFPLRAVVPGWYGMASVKWLSEINVTATPFHGYYQTVDYAYWQRGVGEPSLVPITELQIKAQIARPGPAETVPASKPYLVRGAAWSSGAEIVRVELSPDGGRNWHETRLSEKSDPCAWRLWEYEWQVPAARGQVVLLVRATDAKGRTQPTARDPDRGGYLINEVLGIGVFVQ
jgi:DMSO/TMAO reductase YedYZ molybdopterin-dependent catalytic subunit